MWVYYQAMGALSNVDANTVIQLVGLVVVIISQTIGLYKFVQNGREADRREREAHREAVGRELAGQRSHYLAEAQKLHDRVNDVKDNYVARIDLEKELTRLYGYISEARKDQKDGVDKIERHLHSLQNLMTDTVTKHLAAMVTELAKKG